MTGAPIIRAALDADLPNIAQLQIASWQSAYRGMLPDAYLDGQILSDLEDKWTPPVLDQLITLVAMPPQGGALTGFIACIPDGEKGPYIDNFHVDPQLKGQGIGRCLFDALVEALIAADHSTAWLTVIDRNSAARAAYARLGGQEEAPRTVTLYGQPIVDIPVHWPDLRRLNRGDRD